MLAKYFYEQGDDTVLKIRNHLKEWAKKNDFYINVSMNSVAERVIKEDMKFLGEIPAKINDKDISIINDRCDTKKEKMTALAILCYAKIYKDKNDEFDLSQTSLEDWLSPYIGYHIERTIDMLIGLEYIDRVKIGKTNSWYRKDIVDNVSRFKIKVNALNSGKYILEYNNIDDFYNSTFELNDGMGETWKDIPGYNNWYMISNHKRVKAKTRHDCNGKLLPERIISINARYKSGSGTVKLRDGKAQKNISVDYLFNNVWGVEGCL